MGVSIWEGGKAQELIDAIRELPTNGVQEAVADWLEVHPEVTTTVQDGSLTETKFSNSLKLSTVKDYVTPQMYGYSASTDDVGYYIGKVLEENDVCFVPDGLYKLSTTIYLSGDTYDSHGNAYHHTKGKTVLFGDHAIVDVVENVNVFDVTGNANAIRGGLIDLTSVGSNYNKSVIYLHSSTSNKPCVGGLFERIKIMNANETRTGAGIKLEVSNDGYIYHNVFDNIELFMLEHGILFTGSSSMGMNVNQFTNISYWSCRQCAVIGLGAGNTFTGIGQCAPYRSASDESACFYVNGTANEIDVFIFDVGNPGLIKYMYELPGSARGNFLKFLAGWKYIDNGRENYFIGLQPNDRNDLPAILTAKRSAYFADYVNSGYKKFRFDPLDILCDSNNLLNTEFVSAIECTTTGSVSSYGINLSNQELLKTLAKTQSDNIGIKLVPSAAGTYTLRIKYTFDWTGRPWNGMIDAFALKLNPIETAGGSTEATYEVKQVLSDNSEFTMDSYIDTNESLQLSMFRIFKTPNNKVSLTKSVKELIIDISVNASAVSNQYIMNITKLYATLYGKKSGDSCNGVANRSGDYIFGDYVFKNGTAPVLTASNGKKYRLTIADDGTLSTTYIGI